MSTPSEKLINDAQREIKKQQEIIENIQKYYHLDLIAQAFPEAYFYNSWGCWVTVQLPARFELVDEVKKFMVEQFPDAKLRRDVQHIWEDEKKAGIFLDYYIPAENGHTIELDFTFRTEVKGSTCVLHRIGSKRKTVPVLEMVCSEQTQEWNK